MIQVTQVIQATRVIQVILIRMTNYSMSAWWAVAMMTTGAEMTMVTLQMLMLMESVLV
jgi:hypothetical protein